MDATCIDKVSNVRPANIERLSGRTGFGSIQHDVIEPSPDLVLAVSDTAAGVKGPFNIGNPEEVTVLNLARQIKRLVGIEENIVFRDKAVDDPRRRRPDISRVNEATGWRPRVRLATVLENTISCLRGALGLPSPTAHATA